MDVLLGLAMAGLLMQILCSHWSKSTLSLSTHSLYPTEYFENILGSTITGPNKFDNNNIIEGSQKFKLIIAMTLN